MALNEDAEMRTITENFTAVECLEYWTAKLRSSCSEMEAFIDADKPLSAAKCLTQIQNYANKIAYLTRNENTRNQIDRLGK